MSLFRVTDGRVDLSHHTDASRIASMAMLSLTATFSALLFLEKDQRSFTFVVRKKSLNSTDNKPANAKIVLCADLSECIDGR
jgi:hypothetical protein